jgi:hypothetical protein
LAKDIQNNIPDAELPGVIAVYAAERPPWIVIFLDKKNGGWTVIAVSPDDPEAPG